LTESKNQTMEKFIEVTEVKNGFIARINVSHITMYSQQGDHSKIFISSVTGSFESKESYEEITRLIEGKPKLKVKAARISI
jgi:hypothetical protein